MSGKYEFASEPWGVGWVGKIWNGGRGEREDGEGGREKAHTNWEWDGMQVILNKRGIATERPSWKTRPKNAKGRRKERDAVG